MSRSIRQLAAATSALLGAVLLTVVCATTSQAEPYTNPVTTAASTTNPAVGADLTITGVGFLPGETITNTLHSDPVTLSSAVADASGNFSLVVALPPSFTGEHTIVSFGLTSHRTSTLSIMIGASSLAAGLPAGLPASGGSSSSGLATTGVAVISAGALGLGLLLGGTIMLFISKRRRVSA